MGIGFPRVTRCCFCVPLRLASLLIGYFAVISSCFVLGAVSFYTYKVAIYVRDNKDQPNPYHTQDDLKKSAIALYVSLGYYILVFVYNIVIHVLLIVGIHCNKLRFLKFYINTAYFLFALAVALIVVSCVFMGFVATIPTLKWAFTLAMCIIVVRSTYLEMEEQSKLRSFEMQNLYMPQQAPVPHITV